MEVLNKASIERAITNCLKNPGFQVLIVAPKVRVDEFLYYWKSPFESNQTVTNAMKNYVPRRVVNYALVSHIVKFTNESSITLVSPLRSEVIGRKPNLCLYDEYIDKDLINTEIRFCEILYDLEKFCHEVKYDCTKCWLYPSGACATCSLGNFKPKKAKDDKMKTIKIKYHCDDIDKIKKIPEGNWIDLRAAETVTLKKGESKIISLGVSMKLPDGYEAHVVPRSSTFKTWGIIQTNHMGVIDNSYSGNDDIWGMGVLAGCDTTINKNDRICQFRIVKCQPEIEFEEVEYLDGKNRGGFGSTGEN